MRELVHVFGTRKQLQGIVTLPDETTSVAIVLLNAGSVHKVGPFDLNRDLSKLLGSQGFTIFRFDLGGLGDSRKIKSSATREDTTLREMQDALDFLETHYRITRVITIGLCSGAQNAYRLALADTRVVGNVWLDGYGYANLKGTLLAFKLKFGSFNLIRSRIKRRFANSGRALEDDEWEWVLPSKNQLATGLTALHARGVKILSIYSGGVASYNTYKGQFRDTFSGEKFLESMDFEYYPLADHTYKIRKDRMIMLNRISEWLRQEFCV